MDQHSLEASDDIIDHTSGNLNNDDVICNDVAMQAEREGQVAHLAMESNGTPMDPVLEIIRAAASSQGNVHVTIGQLNLQDHRQITNESNMVNITQGNYVKKQVASPQQENNADIEATPESIEPSTSSEGQQQQQQPIIMGQEDEGINNAERNISTEDAFIHKVSQTTPEGDFNATDKRQNISPMEALEVNRNDQPSTLKEEGNAQKHRKEHRKVFNFRHFFPFNKNKRKQLRAIKKLVEIQNENREDDLEIHSINVPKENIPVVNPRLVKVKFYDGEVSQSEETYQPSREELQDGEETYQPSTEELQNVELDREVKVEDLLTRSTERFISLIGFPGSGKSTLSKRLAKSKHFICFHMKFMDMNYAREHKLTLEDLLLKDQYPDLDSKTCHNAFKWLKVNQGKCLIIMDGFDQAEWTFNTKVPPKMSYDTPQNVWDLVASICNKHFLPGVRLIFTSQPNAMISMPTFTRPDVTYLLQDLSLDDMKDLFYGLAGSNAVSLWQNLNDHSPQLSSLLQNPLMLQFYIRSSINPSTTVGQISTMTCIFKAVLDNLRRSHHAHHDDIQAITGQLARLAFKATNNSTVVITEKQLDDEALTVEQVQDLIIAFQGHKGGSGKVFEGDRKLYFIHQTLQEYYTALYIANEMSLSEFNSFLEAKLFNPYWSIVRKFVAGMLFDNNGFDSADHNAKRSRFKEEILNKLRVSDRNELLDFHIDIRECNDDDVTAAAAEVLPSGIDLSDIPITCSQTHAFACVLRKITSHVDGLNLIHCKLNDRSFQHICSAIRHMAGSIGIVILTGNQLTSDCVDMICEFLCKIKYELWIRDCFVDDRGRYRHANDKEIHKIQQTLNCLPTSRLKVWVGLTRPLTKLM